MRIVGGIRRGVKLLGPGTQLATTRPTADKVRQTLFNILLAHPDFPPLHNATVLDGFAGTGAVGLEALSRGAASVLFVEKHPAASALIHENIALCGVKSQTHVRTWPFERLKRPEQPFDWVFLDPPYRYKNTEQCLSLLVEKNLISPKGMLCLELDKRADNPAAQGYTLLLERATGPAKLLFLSPKNTLAPPK